MIAYGPNAKPLHPVAAEVVTEALRVSGESGVTITSTARTSYDQARIMWSNLTEHGVAAQRRLYAPPGQKVIDCYVAMIHASKADTITAMQHVIEALGPSTVSRHCADPEKECVFDCDPHSLKDAAKFKAALLQHARVRKVLDASNSDPALHAEVVVG